MQKRFFIVAAFISLIIFSSTSFSQNYNDALRLTIPGLGSNARALGMGNAYISLSDDGSAAFFNPAGFGLLKKMEFSGGLDYIIAQNDLTFFDNQLDASENNTRLNRLSFAFPFPTLRGSLVFGLSYHTSKDLTGITELDGFNPGNHSKIQDLLDTDVPFDLYLTDLDNNTIINGMLNQSGSIINDGSINNWTLSGAIEIYKDFFFGLNLNIISGDFQSNSDYYEDDTQNIYQGETATGEPQTTDFLTFNLNNIIDWDIAGWDAKLGFLYQYQDMLRIGATLQFPKTFNIKEKFLVDGFSEFGTGQMYFLDTEFYSDQVEYDIISPFEVGGGASIKIAGLIFSAQATLIDHSQTEFDNPDGLSEQYIADKNREIKELLAAVVNYNLGAEYTFPVVGLRLRGGFFVQPSAFEGDPSDFDRKYFTAGIGYIARGKVGIDLGYAHGWWKDIGDNYGNNLSRTFQDVSVDHFMLTTTYRF